MENGWVEDKRTPIEIMRSYFGEDTTPKRWEPALTEYGMEHNRIADEMSQLDNEFAEVLVRYLEQWRKLWSEYHNMERLPNVDDKYPPREEFHLIPIQQRKVAKPLAFEDIKVAYKAVSDANRREYFVNTKQLFEKLREADKSVRLKDMKALLDQLFSDNKIEMSRASAVRSDVTRYSVKHDGFYWYFIAIPGVVKI